MPGVPPARYAYLGPEGTFTEAALRSLPAAQQAELQPFGSVGAALDAVRSGEADGAVVPIENSVEGAVGVTLDELSVGEPLMITREINIEVQFALLARRGMRAADLRRVATHPHAEAQCRRWLATHLPQAQVVLEASTAHAAAMVAREDSPYDGAVAAPIAARTYRLATLAPNIADRAGAVTRFVLVSRPAPPQPATGADKTSLVVFIQDNHPGALLEMLEQFAARGVDLTRIESRPTGSGLVSTASRSTLSGMSPMSAWEALIGLRRTCADVRFLGSYPRVGGRPTNVAAGTADQDFTQARAWLTRLRHP